MPQKTERDPRDDYPTPDWQSRLLLKYVMPQGTILEPCAGGGAMVRVLNSALTAPVDGEDKNNLLYSDLFMLPVELGGTIRLRGPHFDATAQEYWDAFQPGEIDWVITNPPFTHAFEILKHAYRTANHGVALILRTSFCEPTIKRGPWLAENPPDLRLVMPRTQYKPPTKDTCTTEWMVWLKSNKHRGTIVVPREEANAS